MNFQDIIIGLCGLVGGSGGALAVVKTSLKKYFQNVNNAIEVSKKCQEQLPIIKQRMKEQSSQMNILQSGVLALNQRRLLSDCEYWIDEGYCPSLKKQVLQNMYQSYHDLGGNGVITALFNQVVELPITKKEV